MLVITRLGSSRVHRLDFGAAPLEPPSGVGPHVRWVLADYEARRDQLWDVPPVTAQGELAGLLDDADDEPARLLVILDAMRFYAVPEPGAGAVLRRLDHPDPNVRLYAIGALGSMAKYSTAAQLAPFLDSAHPAERAAAANALAKIATPPALEDLESAAQRDASLARAVARGRQRQETVKEGWVGGLVDPLLAEADDYEDLCLYSNVCVRQIALAASEDERPVEERRRAVRVLGLTRQRKYAGETALELVRDDAADPSLRRTAAWALGRMRDARALPEFDRLLQVGVDKPFELAIVEAIGRIGKSRSLGTLLNHHARRDDSDVRGAIRTALARISEPIQPADPGWEESEAASQWLYVITDDGALLTDGVTPALVGQLGSPSSAARRDALFALSVLPPIAGEEGAAADAAITGVAGEDPDEQTRAAARRALRRRESRRERS